MDADARTGCQFGTHAIVGQRHSIIAGLRCLGGMVEARAVARTRFFNVAGLKRHRVAGHGHDKDVAKIGMARTGKMRV